MTPVPPNRPAADTDSGSSANVPIDDAGRGAIIALVRVMEIHDPAVAHRSALRTLVATRVSEELDLDAATLTHVIATAALADIDLTVSHKDSTSDRDLGRAMLAASLTERIPGLAPVAMALRHQRERWDGTGSPGGLAGPMIPVAARIVAVTDELVGAPAPGFTPTFGPSIARIETEAGRRFDPDIVTAVRRADLGGLEAPPIPSASIVDLFDQAAQHVPSGGRGASASEIAAAVAAASSLNELLALFADIARRTVGASRATVLRMSKTSIEEEPLASSFDAGEPLSTAPLRDLAEFSLLAELRAGVPVTRGAADLHNPADGTTGSGSPVGSDLTVPITLRGQTWGLINVARRQADVPFDNHDLSVLRHIATQASSAIADTVRWAEIERMALRDQLTGLANRHVLNAVLDAVFEREPVERHDVALIMCDVDGLKIVNDTDGHEAGDRLLIDAARSLHGAVRDPDRTTICRIGGDEFCLVIDGGALLTAHEISDTIERLFERSAGSGRPRSISCGIAFAGPDIETRSQLLRAADLNQYETKRARRAARGEPMEDARRTTGDRRAIRDRLDAAT